jgi:uncharacterized membrane protein YdjX (TVP38/TMEM64 family)
MMSTAARRRAILAIMGVGFVAGLAVISLSPGLRTEAESVLRMVARADVAPLREYLIGFGWWAPLISTLLQVITSIVAPLPSFVLGIVNAMLFGWWWGAVLTWTTAMLAAAICFGLARALGRPLVHRFVPRHALASTDRFIVRHGVAAVVIGRLIPFINPDVLSYAAGLTAMRWPLFMASIGVGSVPSVALYSYLGSRGVTSIGWLLIPLIGLGLIAFGAAILRSRREKDEESLPPGSPPASTRTAGEPSG